MPINTAHLLTNEGITNVDTKLTKNNKNTNAKPPNPDSATKLVKYAINKVPIFVYFNNDTNILEKNINTITLPIPSNE